MSFRGLEWSCKSILCYKISAVLLLIFFDNNQYEFIRYARIAILHWLPVKTVKSGTYHLTQLPSFTGRQCKIVILPLYLLKSILKFNGKFAITHFLCKAIWVIIVGYGICNALTPCTYHLKNIWVLHVKRILFSSLYLRKNVRSILPIKFLLALPSFAFITFSLIYIYWKYKCVLLDTFRQSCYWFTSLLFKSQHFNSSNTESIHLSCHFPERYPT